MGRMQREKGKRFERDIAARLRELWPAATIRRASQAERADNPDVFAEGGPPLLSRLWLELQDARHPRPLDKLLQAEHDIRTYVVSRGNRGELAAERLPVVVWHRIRELEVRVTTRLWVLAEISGLSGRERLQHAVTLGLPDFLALLERTTR